MTTEQLPDRQALVPEQLRDIAERHTSLTKTARVTMSKIVPAKIVDSCLTDRGNKPVSIDVQGFASQVADDTARAIAT